MSGKSETRVRFSKKSATDAVDVVRTAARGAVKKAPTLFASFIKLLHTPYLPPIAQHGKRGWLLRYILGPYDVEWVEMLVNDVLAGITIGLTLIPQALSYSTLANLPAVNGLYSNILPAAVYAIFGTSNCLALGPVAIVSLLVAALVSSYNIDYVNFPEEAVNLAAEASLSCGIILAVMGVLNLGSFIRFLSHPVISGFTSAAASLIGLSQLKNAFGFPNVVPQIGSVTGVEYNYQQMQWYVNNWNGSTKPTTKQPYSMLYRNHFAVKLCFGIYIPLVIVSAIKSNMKVTPEMKKARWFKMWTFTTSMLPLIAIIVSAHVAYTIKTTNDSHYAQNLKIVGNLQSGIDIIRLPQMKYPLGQLLIDVIPLTLIGFMESYSVSRKLATSRNELEQLDASQELFAIGIANMFGSFSSSYPVFGSYSRTSLAGTADAKTPFTSCVTIFVVLLSLGTLTSSFFFIPNAALSGIIFTAVTNLISPSDFYEAWIHSKNDFFTMLVTFMITLVFDTSLGLAAGVGVSVIMLLKDIIFSPDSKPFFEILPSSNDARDNSDDADVDDDKDMESQRKSDLTVQIVRLNNDLVFLTAPMIKDTLVDEILNKRGNKFKALIIDFTDVKLIDISGMMAMRECASHTRAKNLRFVLVNVRIKIHERLVKFGVITDKICMDRIDKASTGDLYASVSRLPNNKYQSGIIHEEQQYLLSSEGAPEDSLSLGGINIDDTDDTSENTAAESKKNSI